MYHRITSFIHLALACSFCFALLLPTVAAGQQGNAEGASSQREDTILLYGRYRILFRRLAGTQSNSQGAGAPVRTGDARYRDQLQREVSLSDEQARSLMEIAEECERQVSKLDARAREMIAAFRAQSARPTSSTDEQSTSSSAQSPRSGLAALEEERRSVIMQSREKLREAFGEEVFQRFDKYITSHGSIKAFTLPSPGRPEVPLQVTTTVLAADGRTAKKQFRVGEKILIQIKLQNNSPHEINVRQSDLYNWFELYHAEDSLRAPLLTEPDEKEPQAEAAQMQNVELFPGQQTIAGTFDLSNIQKQLKPGRYVMRAYPHVLLNRPPDKSEIINLTSDDDKVEFEIVP